MHEELKLLHNPKPSKLNPGKMIGGSTTKLDTQDFFEYIEKIKRWASIDYGIVLPEPEDLWQD